MKLKFLEDFLLDVEKPVRYIGNEWNMVKKDKDKVDVRFAFCFPDVYEIGMSHLGMKILYHLLNQRDDTYCERVFAPWIDMEAKMRERNIRLFALETKDELLRFDILGFTLQYEMSYTNIINMLNLAGVPILSNEREFDFPLICAGGPCTCNPEPLAEIIDFFLLGESEELINEIIDIYITSKKEGLKKNEFLEKIALIEGVYVPKFYNIEYFPDETIKSITPINEKYPKKVIKRIIKDLDKSYFPEKIIVPYTDIVHDRVMLELFRGCIRGCRFCQAGFIYRPVRERSKDRLIELAKSLEESTGYEEISLTSLSTSDYTDLNSFVTELIENMEPKNVNLSLPSLRVDSFSLSLMEKVQKVRKSGITLAPEAGSQRLRDVINKGVTEEDLINSVRLVFNASLNSVKLYFMLGLPTETYEDIEGIYYLAEKVIDTYMSVPKEKRQKGLKITISTSCFVPKPFTPFQWEAQDSIELLNKKQGFLKSKLKSKFISYNWHDSRVSFLEAILARGDRKIGRVLIKAYEKGCKFDSWGEYFDFEKWMEAFKECGIDPTFYANRKRDYKEIFPWEHIDFGVKKDFLIKESEKAYKEQITSNCRLGCSACGANVLVGGGRC